MKDETAAKPLSKRQRRKLKRLTFKKPRRDITEDILNWPNFLTMLRVLFIPLVLYTIQLGTPKANFWAASIYALMTVTDFFDGYLARRMKIESVFGKYLDPLADKLLVASTLIYLLHIGRAPAWCVVLILARELAVTSLRVIAMSEHLVMAAGQGGKEKTALQMLAILMLILHQDFELNFLVTQIRVDFHVVGLWLLYLSVFFAITSAGEYVQMFVKAVEQKKK